MPGSEIQYRDGGIHLPQLRLWLDPHRPKQDLTFVSHAHADHMANHAEVILTAPTARLMTARIGGRRTEHVLNFGEQRLFRKDDSEEFAITLLSAGHIFGSAMSFIECDEGSLFYTGDFKLRAGLACEPCAPCHADTLIMETTFGQPRYQFPPAGQVAEDIVRFCRDTLAAGENAVLQAYSLGKSQELLYVLREAQLPVVLHRSVFAMTKIYEEFGHSFPAHEEFVTAQSESRVIIWPPNVPPDALAAAGGKSRHAAITGWALDSSCKYRNRCDEAFPLSDHADFPELIEFVKLVRPRRVLTLHGFAADFAAALRRLGYDAWSLSQDEQLELALPLAR